MSVNRPLSCVLFGSESLLVQCGEVLADGNHEIAAVVSSEDPILDWAASRGIPTLRPGRDLAARLALVAHDYLFSISNLSIVSEEILALPRRAAINFHDGPLPRYAGMYTPAWALINGETEYGVTFYEIDPGASEGDIYYAQRLFEIAADETSLTLNTKCYEAAIEAFSELVDGLADGTASKRPQDVEHRTYFARDQRPAAACVLDWTQPADVLSRQVRAMDFGHYPNEFSSARLLHGSSVYLLRAATPMEGRDGAEPGRVLAIDDESLTIACAGGTALRASGWTCIKGQPLTSPEVVERMGVSEGDVLDIMTEASRAQLDELGGLATHAEAFWVRRLRELEPVEPPYRNAESQSAEVAKVAEIRGIEIELSGSFGPSRDSGGAQTWIAGFGAYLARVSGRTSFDVAYSDDSLRTSVGTLAELFCASVPLRIEIDQRGTTDDVTTAVRRSLDRVAERGAFFADLPARYPELAANPDLLAGSLSSVAVDVREDPSAGDLPIGTDCALVVDPSGKRARFIHDERVLSSESADAIAQQLQIFMAGFADPATPLRKIPMMDPTDRTRVLVEWNQTSVEYPRDRCIHELFDSQVALRPNDVAAVCEGTSLDYRTLAERSNQLAHHLVELGIGPDRLVGIYLPRSIDMLVGVLAVLKAGGAYVPLDPTYPADRVAYMIEDSKASVLLTVDRLVPGLSDCEAKVVAVDRDADAIAAHAATPPQTTVKPDDLSYVIYTSGSTGKPKGVMVEHRNVVNFFAGMDERIPHETPGVWLALTSLSFDISVLELLWTLTRGFKLIVHVDRERAQSASDVLGPWRPMDFGLMLWGNDTGPGPRKYELMLEAAKFGDTHGFRSVHTPERHFGAFGGPFPNPSVTGAAIAAVTSRIEIRASSCVLPLHSPIRVAEDWSVVDNLSNGRVGISFAAGWQPNDFVIRPEAFADAKKKMFEGAAIVQRLWRGEAVDFENPLGDMVPTSTLPRPVQKELPSWMTTAGNVDTFRAAGAGGFNVLTHLLGQTLEELAEKIKVYRQGRESAGLDPATGIVTCMLHTYVGENIDEVREIVREPMKQYLGSAMALVVGFAWSFPAFERPGGPDSKPEDVDLATLTEEETDAILEFAFERYFETSGLFGTPEICSTMVDRVKAADIDDIACLIDYGVPNDVMLASLPLLDRVRREANEVPAGFVAGATEAAVGDYSLPTQITEHGVTHMQCTPSHATMLLTDPDARAALASVDHWMIGGEAFPVSLASDLCAAGCRNVTNMYGPTETTIWSSTEVVEGRPTSISIGRPIANTQFYILGAADEPLPIGIPGELLIGGEGVVRGYLERADLTAERFIPDPFRDDPTSRLYRTGDLASWKADGTIEFLGRLDHQVKIRGYRIELGEIEARLSAVAGVREAVVIPREDVPGDVRLVAYLIAEDAHTADAELREALSENLPEFMIPSAFLFLDRYPQTPNGKIDRKALPAPNEVRTGSTQDYKPPDNELEETIAGIWQDVLYQEQVGIDDNFFDLGGHSLLVVQAHRKLREQCPMPISLTDLYRFPTIRSLSEHLGSDQAGGEEVEKSQARGEKRRQAMGRRRKRGSRK